MSEIVAEVPARAKSASQAPAVPQPYRKPPSEVYLDHLQMAEAISTILAFNYLGDGAFDEPAEAPGIGPMCQAVADLLAHAESAALTASINAPAVIQARAFADHLAALSREELTVGHGFRIDGQTVGLCYWTIEKMVNRAFREHAA